MKRKKLELRTQQVRVLLGAGHLVAGGLGVKRVPTDEPTLVEWCPSQREGGPCQPPGTFSTTG